MENYIIASCKEWHRDSFEKNQRELSGNWTYVESQKELKETLEAFNPRYIFFLHWNWVVPREIWSKYECVCFHMTDVPYGRGGSPLQNLIVAGVESTKVTALRMIEEMDAGPVYAKRPMSLDGRAEEIYLRAGELSWDLIRWIVAAQPTPVPQEGEIVYFARRKPEQSAMPTHGDLVAIYDHIRMLDAPTYPLAFIDYGDFRMEFCHARVDGDEIRADVILRHKNTNGESL